MTKDFHIIVQKYGGSSVADPPKLKSVAQFIKSALEPSRRICVVVSAMGHTTNELISLAYQTCSDPPKRELDMLISCGERSSMALLAMALNDIGVKSMSLTGSQSGIITDDNHSGAEIIAVKPSRVLQAFSCYQAVIVAGFQGVSLKKEITTLRRGGSDTTAVALAAALNAKVCEIYTDVPGVMDADPRIVACAEVLPTLTFDQMEAMTLYGAKVVAHDAVKLAKQFNVALHIKKTGHDLGTEINSVEPSSDREVLSFTHLRGLLCFSLRSEELNNFTNSAGYFLCGSLRDKTFVGYMSNDISQELINLSKAEVRSGLALITMHMPKNQVALTLLIRVTDILKKYSIQVQDLLLGRNEIFLVIADDKLNDVLSILRADLVDGVCS